MEGYGGPAQPSAAITQLLNGGYGWLEVKCHRYDTKASIALDAIGRQQTQSGNWRCVPQVPIMPQGSLRTACSHD
jgi:hypothetical protein